MTEAEQKIGHEFKNKALLERALTHSSYANENHTKNNERLEFLGDSVLSVIISDYIFRKMQNVDEGDLSKFRASLVCEKSLAEVARKIYLSELVFLGKGEDKTGGRHRPSVISDAFEAVLASIYLDAGIETARAWLLPLMADKIDAVLSGKGDVDYKTALQELVQRDGRSTVTYSTVSVSGAEHMHRFVVQVEINGAAQCRAAGHSKKDAEQHAAQLLLQKFKNAQV